MDVNWMVKDMDGNTSTESVGSEEGKRNYTTLIVPKKLIGDSHIFFNITSEHRILYARGLAHRRKSTAAKTHNSSSEEDEEDEATQKRIAAHNFMIHHGSIGIPFPTF